MQDFSTSFQIIRSRLENLTLSLHSQPATAATRLKQLKRTNVFYFLVVLVHGCFHNREVSICINLRKPAIMFHRANESQPYVCILRCAVSSQKADRKKKKKVQLLKVFQKRNIKVRKTFPNIESTALL